MTQRAPKRIRVEDHSGWVLHQVSHELVGAAAFRMCHALENLDRARTRGVVIDLSAVSTIDASGVVALVRIYSGYTHRRVGLRIVGAREDVRKRLESVGLTRLVEVADIQEPVSMALSMATS